MRLVCGPQGLLDTRCAKGRRDAIRNQANILKGWTTFSDEVWDAIFSSMLCKYVMHSACLQAGWTMD